MCFSHVNDTPDSATARLDGDATDVPATFTGPDDKKSDPITGAVASPAVGYDFGTGYAGCNVI